MTCVTGRRKSLGQLALRVAAQAVTAGVKHQGTTMRIITLGRVAGIGDGDNHFYEGSGYLLRFGIDSADQFFSVQLPFIVETLGIDAREIIRIELLGDGRSGLRQVAVCISFEDPASGAERPEEAIGRLWDAPATPPNDTTICYDVLHNRLMNFFLLAPTLRRHTF